MNKTRSIRTSQVRRSSGEILPEGFLLPDEDANAYRLTVAEVLEEFAPQTPYQRRLAINLANIEWELVRHHRLLAAHVRTEFREQAQTVGKHGPSRAAVSAAGPELGKLELGGALLSDDPKLRQQGEDYLTIAQVTRSEITAAAYDVASLQIGWHEGRIADLERRRRALLADYRDLQERPRKVMSIIDAEVIE